VGARRKGAAGLSAGPGWAAAVKDLTETLRNAGGAGLAAPQIGVGLRVFASSHPLGGRAR
jgi:peptide deformylase